MRILVFLALIGIATCNIQTELMRLVVDKLFSRLDHSPKDNFVTVEEWEKIISDDDYNNDYCVTMEEYKRATNVPIDSINTNMFHHFDRDKDGCMTVKDMEEEFKLIDTDGDGKASLQDFENHMIKVIKEALGGTLSLRAIFG